MPVTKLDINRDTKQNSCRKPLMTAMVLKGFDGPPVPPGLIVRHHLIALCPPKVLLCDQREHPHLTPRKTNSLLDAAQYSNLFGSSPLEIGLEEAVLATLLEGH